MGAAAQNGLRYEAVIRREGKPVDEERLEIYRTFVSSEIPSVDLFDWKEKSGGRKWKRQWKKIEKTGRF